MTNSRYIALLVTLTFLIQALPSSATYPFYHLDPLHPQHAHLVTKGAAAFSMEDVFKSLYAFGDSLTDTANAMFMGMLRHAPGGSQGVSGSSPSGNHLCDGKLLIDFVCEALGLPPVPAFQNASANFTFGANFAVAGSTLLPMNFFTQNNIHSWFLNAIPKGIELQIDWFHRFLQGMAGLGNSHENGGSGSGYGSGSISGKISGSGDGSVSGSGKMSGSGDGSVGGSGSMSGSGNGSGSGSGSGSTSGGMTGTGNGSGSASGSMSGSVGGSGGASGSGGGSGSGNGSMSGSGGGSGGASGSAGGSGSGSMSGSGGASVSGSGSMTGKTSGSGSGSGSVNVSGSIHMDSALFWLGGIGLSDFPRLLGSSSISSQWFPQHSVNQVSKLVESLLEKGATYVVVQGLPPCGCFPVSLALTPASDRDHNGCSASANAMVTAHNELLQKSLAELQKTYSSASIIYADFWKAYMNILENHDKYNFAEPFKACCGAGGGALNFDVHHLCGSINTATCRDAAQHMIWDGIHLTEAMNKEVANQFLHHGCTSPPLQDVIKKKMG